MEKKKNFDLKQSNFTYLFLIGSFLCISLGAGLVIVMAPQAVKDYTLEITTALQLITYIPLMVYAFNSNTDIKSVLRLKSLKLKQTVLTVLLMLAFYIIVTYAAMLWQSFLAMLGANVEVPDALNDLFNKPVWFSVFLLCIYAPFFEEFIFRGMILSGYAAYKSFWKAVIITGCLFGMMHGFLPSVLPTAIVGVAIAALVLYTGSIFAGVLYHALHNLLAYTMWMDQYFLELPWKLNLAPPIDTLQGQLSKFIWMSCWAIVAVFAAVFIFRALKKDYQPADVTVPADNRHRLLFAFALGMAVILIIMSSVTMFLPKGFISG